MTLEYGEVVFSGDSVTADQIADDDRLPDQLPLAGYVDFTPSVRINYDTVEGKLKYMQPVTAALDETGALRDAQGGHSLLLVATSSAALQNKDWTWVASFRLNVPGIGPFRFNLAPGQRKNIANIDTLLDLTVPSATATQNPDGSVAVAGTSVIDNGDGTFTASSPALIDNGDGTFTFTS